MDPRGPICLVCDREKKPSELESRTLLCRECRPLIDKFFRYYFLWFTRVGEISPESQAAVYDTLDEPFKRKLTHAMGHWRHLLMRDIHWHDKYQEEFLWSDGYVQLVTAGNQSGKTAMACAKVAQLIAARSRNDYPVNWPERFRFHPTITTNRKGEQEISNPVLITIGTDEFKDIDDVLLPKIREYFPDWPDDDRSNEFWEISRDGGYVQMMRYKVTGARIRIVTNEQARKGAMRGEGTQMHCFWFDEPPNERLYTGALRSIMVKGGFIMITATPLSEPWLMTRVAFSTNKGMRWYKWDMDQNGTWNGGPLTKEAQERLLEGLSEEERMCRKSGVFLQAIGSYFAPLLNKHKDQIYKNMPKPLPKDWFICMAMDYHLNTPARIVWCAVNRLGQKIFFKELVVGRDTAGDSLVEIVDAIQAVEDEWGTHEVVDAAGVKRIVKNRVGARLVDQAMDIEIVGIKVSGNNEKVTNYSNFNRFNQILSARGMRTLEKVTGAQGYIKLAQEMMTPVKVPHGKETYTRVIIDPDECTELADTLPLYRKKVFRGGDRNGMPYEGKNAADKAGARGAHAIDAFLYLVGENLVWEEMNAVEPDLNVWGRLRRDMESRNRRSNHRKRNRHNRRLTNAAN